MLFNFYENSIKDTNTAELDEQSLL
jgi:hypothetical protein